jgi:hypothetical protein
MEGEERDESRDKRVAQVWLFMEGQGRQDLAG